MELANKVLENIAFNTRPIKHSTREQNLIEPLQTNNKQFKIAIKLLTCNNGIINITNENKKFFYNTPDKKTDDIVIPKGKFRN